MPKLVCRCGHVINLSEIPCPHGLLLISESEIEPLVDQLLQACQTQNSIKELEWQFYTAIQSTQRPGIRQAYICPHCGRMAIFSNTTDNTPVVWLTPETEF